MILKLVVLFGLALYLASQGRWLLGLLALVALWPSVGLIIAIVLAVLLVLAKEGWAAVILGTLIIGNLIGNYVVKRRTKENAPMADVNINFVRYCKEYLEKRCGLTATQAQILVLDPELGPAMDEAKLRWVWQDLPLGTDPDDFLVPQLFEEPEMKRINALLSKFAMEYAEREPRILDYLRSIGHPLGRMKDTP